MVQILHRELSGNLQVERELKRDPYNGWSQSSTGNTWVPTNLRLLLDYRMLEWCQIGSIKVPNETVSTGNTAISLHTPVPCRVPKSSIRSNNSGGGVFLVSSELKSRSPPWDIPILGEGFFLVSSESKFSMRSSNSGVEDILGKLRTGVLSPPQEIQIRGGGILGKLRAEVPKSSTLWMWRLTTTEQDCFLESPNSCLIHCSSCFDCGSVVVPTCTKKNLHPLPLL